MADTRFIRTVEFGGYDRNDVIKRFEFLNTQLFDLKNELRETKMLIEEYKKGSSEEKAHEAVLTQEKVKLTSLQVQNETASTKLKAAEEDKAKLAEELAALKATHADTLKELEDAKSKLKGRYILSQETNATRAYRRAYYELFDKNFKFGYDYPRLIDNVTKEDVINVSKRIFSNPYVMSIVAPEEYLKNEVNK